MASRSFASRLESGSSSSSSCGSVTSARASARRCCWPPDSLVAWRSASSASPTASSTRRTRWPISVLPRRWRRGTTSSGNETLLNTLMCGQIAYDWKTMPSPRLLAGTLTRRLPSNSTVSLRRMTPASGRSRPATDRSVVVLPQPDGPSSVNRAPSWTSKLTPSTANSDCSPARDRCSLSARDRLPAT